MKILVVSGFLGAGKTTFIKTLAKKINIEFVVVENEYADVGVDGDFFDEQNIDIREISEGCICCSMQGNFKAIIKNIYEQVNPEFLIIEPTGVGMLSSILKNIKEIENCDITLLNPISFIDIKSFDECFDTFNEYFVDNVKHTGKIVLTKLENESISNINRIENELRKLNSSIEIIKDDYRNFSTEWFGKLLNTTIENRNIESNFSIAKHINLKTFSSKNVKIKDMDSFGLFLNKLLNDEFGKVYRAKGFLNIEGQWGKFNLVHKNFDMEACQNIEESKIIIIGNNLNIDLLKNYLEV